MGNCFIHVNIAPFACYLYCTRLSLLIKGVIMQIYFKVKTIYIQRYFIYVVSYVLGIMICILEPLSKLLQKAYHQICMSQTFLSSMFCPRCWFKKPPFLYNLNSSADNGIHKIQVSAITHQIGTGLRSFDDRDSFY